MTHLRYLARAFGSRRRVTNKAIFGENQGKGNHHGHTGDGYTNRQENIAVKGAEVECAKKHATAQKHGKTESPAACSPSAPSLQWRPRAEHTPKLGITPPGNRNTTGNHGQIHQTSDHSKRPTQAMLTRPTSAGGTFSPRRGGPGPGTATWTRSGRRSSLSSAPPQLPQRWALVASPPTRNTPSEPPP